jgi:hypothetical protein
MKHVATTLCLILIMTQAVVMQTPQKPQPEIAPDEIIRITTSLVQTDVVIVDKDDHVIPDIKLDEIKVSDNGKRQDVKFLEFVAPDAAPRIEGKLSIAGNAVESDAARNLTAGDLRRVFAFVVDDLTIPFEDIPNVGSCSLTLSTIKCAKAIWSRLYEWSAVAVCYNNSRRINGSCIRR